MPVPWTEWIPRNLRVNWKHGENDLKSSSTTRSYSGGNPASMTDIKPSVVDYDTGLVREGLVFGDRLKHDVSPYFGSDIVPPSPPEGGWNTRPGTGTSEDGKYVLDTTRTGTRRVLEPGRAFNFTGLENVEYDPVAWVPALPFTMCGRSFYNSAELTGTSAIFSLCNPAVTNEYYYVYTSTSGHLVVSRRYGGSSSGTTLYADDLSNKWFSWAVSFIDPTTIRAWIDGAEVFFDDTLDSRGFDSAANVALLGTYRILTPGFYFKGKLHDMRIYNRVLVGDEPLEIAKSGDVVDINSLVFWDKCESVDSSVSYDSSGNGAVGTKVNFVKPTNFHEGADVPKSYQNDHGFTEPGIPRDESDITKDVLGNPLQHQGECPRDIRIRQSACASFDGVAADVRIPSRVSSTTATSWDWEGLIYAPVLTTSTSYIVANRGGSGGWAIVGQNTGAIYIQRGTGSGYEVLLETDDPIPVNTWLKVKAHMESQNWVLQVEDAETGELFFYGTENTADFIPPPSLQAYFLGSLGGASPWEGSIADAKLWLDGNPRCFLPLSEGSGTTCHNVLQNDFHGEVRNTTEADVWALRQDQFHYNLINGWGEREYFDGTGDGYEVATGVSYTAPEPFAIECRIEGLPVDTTARGLTVLNSHSAGVGVRLFNDVLRFQTGGASGYLSLPGATNYEGQLIRFEWDGVSRKAYVDGNLEASDTTAPLNSVTNDSIYVGQSSSSGADPWIGTIRDLKWIINGTTVLDLPRVQAGQKLENPLLEGSRPAAVGTVPNVWQQYNIGGALVDDADSVASNGILRIRSAQSTGTSRGGIFLNNKSNITNGRNYTLRVRMRVNSFAGATSDFYAFINGQWLQVLSNAEVKAWNGHWITVTKQITATAVTDGNFIIASRLQNPGDSLDYTLASVLLTDAEVPALLDGSTTAGGGEITYDAGNWHNNAATMYDFQQEPDAPWHDKVWKGYVYTNNGPQGLNVNEIVPALAGTEAFTMYALVIGGSGNTIGRIISSGVAYRLDANLYRSAASNWVQAYDGSAVQDFTDLIPVDNEWQELVVQWNATELMAWLNGTKSAFIYPTTYNPAGIDQFGLLATYLSAGTAPLIDHYVGRIRLVTEAADPTNVLKLPALADWIFNDGLIEDYSGNGYHLLNNEPDVITPVKAFVPKDHHFNEYLDPEAWQKRYVDRTQEDNYIVRRNQY